MKSVCTLHAALLLAMLGGATRTYAQAPDSSMRLVAPGSVPRLPLGTTRRIRFTTTEGTWMSLDVSPNGKLIVFDMLGDLYLLPITGGRAHRISSGPAFDRQPRFSPDGRHIAFVSDRDGANNIWVCDLQGGEMRRVSDERLNDVGSPAWTPDGKHIIARRMGIYSVEAWHGASLWRYSVNRSAPPARLTAEGGDNSGPAVTGDGIVYFSEVQSEPAKLWRLDLVRNRVDSVPGVQYPALRPTVSHDGALLAYPVGDREPTAIHVLDISHHTDRLLVRGSTRAYQAPNSPNDDVPGYAFTPDDRSLVYTADGHIQRVDIASGRSMEIPFSAIVDQQLPPLLHSVHRFPDSTLKVRQTFGHRLFVDSVSRDSADVFAAVGGLFEWRAHDRRARQIVSPASLAFDPNVASDGRSVVFATYPDTGSGHVEMLTLHGDSIARRIDRPTTLLPRVLYSSPFWATDHRSVFVVRRQFKFIFLGPEVGEASICRMYLDDRPEACVGQWSAQQTIEILEIDGTDRLLYAVSDFDQPANGDAQGRNVTVREIDLHSGSDRAIVKIRHVSYDIDPPSRQVAITPDRRYVAFQFQQDAYVQRIDSDTTVALDASRQIPGRHRVSIAGARDLQWLDGGTVLGWSYANVTYRALRQDILKSDHQGPIVHATRIDLQIARHIPGASVVLRGATAITMGPAGIIASADILITHNRIVAVGTSGSIAIPQSTPVFDVHGLTIIPGLIDTHFHTTTSAPYAYDQPQLRYWLAAGITTARDPNSSHGMFVETEQLAASDQPTPRLVGTGPGMAPAVVSIGSIADALTAVRRYRSDGAVALKQYQQPDRAQRQWLRMGAGLYSVNMTNEGGSDFMQSMTIVMDGFTGVEHQFWQGRIYNDVIRLVARSGTAYTPTLLGDELWWLGVHSDPQALALHGIVSDSLSNVADLPPAPATVTVHADSGQWRSFAVGRFREWAVGMAAIAHRGGRVTFGTHDAGSGFDPRLGIWVMVFGGMTPLEALRCATQYGADAIGYGHELGSIESGKLADLVILDGSPVDDIRALWNVRYVMVDGRLRTVHRSLDGGLLLATVNVN